MITQTDRDLDPDIPSYVWDLLDAYLQSKPLDFHGHKVPLAMQEVLERELEL